MKKFFAYSGIVIVVFFISIGCGALIYKTTNPKSNDLVEKTPIAKIEEKEMSDKIENELEALQTDSSAEKTTPNTRLVLKKYFTDCRHTINEYVQIPEEMVNKTEEEIEKEYAEWKIEKFSCKQLELVKEVEGLCNQHYVLRPKDGVVTIYKIDENGTETLQEETAIATEYLAPEDLEKLEQGIYVYGEENLNAIIEDFE